MVKEHPNIRFGYNGIETNELLKEEFEDTNGGNQSPFFEEKLTTQWPKKDKSANNDLQSIHIKLARKSGNVDFSKLINTEL